MKNIKLIILLAISTLTFSSCDSDDNNDNNEETINYETEIIGVWEVDTFIINGVNEVFEDECQEMETIEFKADNTIFRTELDPIDGECLEAVPSLGVWSVAGDVLTLTWSQIGSAAVSETYGYKIIELTNSMLKIELSNIDVDEDGEIDVYQEQYVK